MENFSKMYRYKMFNNMIAISISKCKYFIIFKRISILKVEFVKKSYKVTIVTIFYIALLGIQSF